VALILILRQDALASCARIPGEPSTATRRRS
jgi:hypothetical protein